ncbi:MAG: nuclear transport factor 2 family protein [Steroidobacteraceae bacterium]
MSQENVEKLRRFYGLASSIYSGSHLPPELKDLVHPKLVVHEPDSLPYGGVFHGFEAFTKMLAKTIEFYEFESLKPRAWIPHEDFVVVLNDAKGKIKATNKAFEQLFIAIWRFEDGKVREGQITVFDSHAIMVAANLAGPSAKSDT